MAETYTRQSSFADGDVIRAAHANDEFNQLVRAFNADIGHNHDGTLAGGAKIPTIQDLTGANTLELTALGIEGNVMKDEDDMLSDSEYHVPSQQSVKAYVDTTLKEANTFATNLDTATRTFATDLDTAARTFTTESVASAVGDMDSSALSFNSEVKVQATATGATIKGALITTAGDEIRTSRTYMDTVPSTLIGSQGSLGPNDTYVNLWATGGTYTLNESSFQIGDKVIVSKLYESGPTVTIVTDSGSFLYNGNDITDTITLDTGYKFKTTLHKIDTINWIIEIGGV